MAGNGIKLIAIFQAPETINSSSHKFGAGLSTENNLLLIFPLIAFPRRRVWCLLVALLYKNYSLESTVNSKSEAYLKQGQGSSQFILALTQPVSSEVFRKEKDQGKCSRCPLTPPPWHCAQIRCWFNKMLHLLKVIVWITCGSRGDIMEHHCTASLPHLICFEAASRVRLTALEASQQPDPVGGESWKTVAWCQKLLGWSQHPFLSPLGRAMFQGEPPLHKRTCWDWRSESWGWPWGRESLQVVLHHVGDLLSFGCLMGRLCSDGDGEMSSSCKCHLCSFRYTAGHRWELTCLDQSPWHFTGKERVMDLPFQTTRRWSLCPSESSWRLKLQFWRPFGKEPMGAKCLWHDKYICITDGEVSGGG